MTDNSFSHLHVHSNFSFLDGATRPEQVEQNAKAVDWVLTPEDLTEIDNPAKQAARA